ncbi:MAG: hypothetical protein IKI28_10040 [Bacteroidales bacterium]|nr:hypothetical protein [Bacteroidales bacterium]
MHSMAEAAAALPRCFSLRQAQRPAKTSQCMFGCGIAAAENSVWAQNKESMIHCPIREQRRKRTR